MKMRRFLFNKLAREKSVKTLEDKGAVFKLSKLDDNNEYLEALTQKIVEELEEVFECESQEELIVELADLEEAFDSFKRLVKIDQKDVNEAKKAKREHRGDFESRLFVEHVDIPESAAEDIEYFASLPDRYPEVDPKTGEFLENDDDE